MKAITILVPLVLSIASFVLAMIALFAGNKPGSLEDLHIIAINMSDFGHDLVPTKTKGSKEATNIARGIGGIISDISSATAAAGGSIASATSELGSAATSAAAELSDIEDDIADKLAQKLGIKQWYSLHVMTTCQGDFAPNATAPDAWYNVTNCTAPQAGFQFNLSEVLDHQLSVGPLHLNTNQLKVPDDITDAVKDVNKFLMAIFVFFALGAAFSGLAFLGNIAALTTRNTTGGIALGNTALAAVATLVLMISAAMTTGVAKKGKSEIDDKGSAVGISASAGNKMIAITWASFGTMFVAMVYWASAFVMGRRSKNRSPGRLQTKEISRPSADTS